jgi:hypothetical protein
VLLNIPLGTISSRTPGMSSTVPSRSTVACVKYAAKLDYEHQKSSTGYRKIIYLGAIFVSLSQFLPRRNMFA